MNRPSEQDIINGALLGAVSSPSVATSAVSWSAILAGAAAAAALSLILLLLGTGLGLSSLSPWRHAGVSATTIGVSTILWVTLTQFVAYGMGGYLAGRLRTKWPEVETNEVYFRDTAHGFLTWAVASLASAILLTSVIGSIIGDDLASARSFVPDTAAYVTHADGAPGAPLSDIAKAEAAVQLTVVDARALAEEVRKASAYAALWLFISLLCGAFAASLAATYGGRRRDA